MRGKSRVHANIVGEVHDTEAVRSDHPHAIFSDLVNEPGFQLASVLPRLLESGGNHDQTLDAFFTASIDHVEDRIARNHDNRKVDLVGNFIHAFVAFRAVNEIVFRINRKDGSLVIAHDQVHEHRMVDRTFVIRRPDYCYGRRPEYLVEICHLFPPDQACSIPSIFKADDGQSG